MDFLRKCSKCGKMLCLDCMQLENHNCIPIERNWTEYAKWQQKFKIIKQKNKNNNKIINNEITFLCNLEVISREKFIEGRIQEEINKI